MKFLYEQDKLYGVKFYENLINSDNTLGDLHKHNSEV